MSSMPSQVRSRTGRSPRRRPCTLRPHHWRVVTITIAGGGPDARASSLRTMRSDAAAWLECQLCEPSSSRRRSELSSASFESRHGSIAFAVHASTALLITRCSRCGHVALIASSSCRIKPRTGRSLLCSKPFISSSTTPYPRAKRFFTCKPSNCAQRKCG